MDKEKEIEEMVKVIRDNARKNLDNGYVCTVDDDVRALFEAGYGNVKQAVKEFAIKLKTNITNDGFEQLCQDGAASESDVFYYIYETLKELGYGDISQ